MDKVNRIFDQLDDWRHLPTYQLERRADIFFSLYLREILQESTGEEIHEVIIPEFTLRKATLDPNNGNNQHFCADYLAFSSQLKRAFLVELKTDPKSGNDKQNEYLRQARDVGLEELLRGLIAAFKPGMSQQTRQKRLYLLKKFASIGMVSGLKAAAEFASRERHQGFTKALEQVSVASVEPKISLVFIHPRKFENRDESEGSTFDYWVSFEQVLKVVGNHTDILSQRFAEALKDWSENTAGSRNFS